MGVSLTAPEPREGPAEGEEGEHHGPREHPTDPEGFAWHLGQAVGLPADPSWLYRNDFLEVG